MPPATIVYASENLLRGSKFWVNRLRTKVSLHNPVYSEINGNEAIVNRFPQKTTRHSWQGEEAFGGEEARTGRLLLW
jgi:hypothetical protein